MIEKGYVYILEMRNGKYYVGSTRNVERRIEEHKRGLTTSTRNNRPLNLLYTKEFDSIHEAQEREIKLKKRKSRKKIEEFMGLLG